MGSVHWGVILTLLCGHFASVCNTTTRTTTSDNNDNIITDLDDDAGESLEWRDTISVRLSRNGLRQLRIAYGGVLVLETSQLSRTGVTLTQNDTQHVATVTRLLQVTNGRRLVQTVLHGNLMTDCSSSRNSEDVLRFLDEYVHSNPNRAVRGDVFAAYSESSTSPPSTANSSTSRSSSSSPYAAVEDALSTNSRRNRRRHRLHNKSKHRILRKGVTMRIRDRRSLGRFAQYLNIRQQVRKCVKFYSSARQRLRIAGVADTHREEEGAGDPQEVVEQSVDSQESSQSSKEERAVSRKKRDLLSGWFIFPGTKWCGDGDIAEHGDDLGYDEALDTCCREHDKCPHVIPRVSWKYSLFNYRLHTLSHCRCDRRFRKCLKKSTSPSAHMVGKIYFNVIGPQCFKFTRSKTCKRRNWWGKCKRYGFTKVAYPKTQKYY